MVYVRTIKVKGRIYYEIVKSKRNLEGNPRQEYIKYLSNNSLSELDLAYLSSIDKNISEKEKMIKEIFHKVHNLKNGRFDIERFFKKCTHNGVSKELAKEYLELHNNKYIVVETSKKNKSYNLGEKHFKDIEKMKSSGFNKVQVEKVVRLNLILMELIKNKKLKEDLCFFGGTAINSVYKNYPRLSVDIDLQYIKNNSKEEMLKDKEKIIEIVNRILKSMKYEFIENKRTYALHQFFIKYKMMNNHEEKIKVEINFFSRKILLTPKIKEVKTLIDTKKVKMKVLQLEELYARKYNALTDRKSSRDLYDFSKLENYDSKLLLKCILGNFLLAKKNLKKDLIKKSNINLIEYKNNLSPLVSKKEEIKIETLIENTNKNIKNIFSNLDNKMLKEYKNLEKNPTYESIKKFVVDNN